MIPREKFNTIWHYFLSLESDIANTAQYMEPIGQEHVFSFEFAKILILSCTEVESLFKLLCTIITGKDQGTIAEYKNVILGKYPRIIEATVTVSRLNKSLKPFDGWDIGKLNWWDAYQSVKHSRGTHFKDATYINAIYSLSALYILIFYLKNALGISDFYGTETKYIHSEYANPLLLINGKPLPDFEVSK